jgi:hypothetical protein
MLFIVKFSLKELQKNLAYVVGGRNFTLLHIDEPFVIFKGIS